jgi:hypothetical protein
MPFPARYPGLGLRKKIIIPSCLSFALPAALNLDSAVRSMHLTQPIDSPGKTGEDLITNKVTATSPVSPDKSIDYAMHALPTAESRLKKDLHTMSIRTFFNTTGKPKSCAI